MNSVLQQLTKVAPNIRLPLASSRMTLKKSDSIDAKTCISLHNEVVQYMGSDAQAQRWVAQPVQEAGTGVPAFKVCSHRFSMGMSYTAPFVPGLKEVFSNDNCKYHVWHFQKYAVEPSADVPAFIVAAHYTNNTYLAKGHIGARSMTFSLDIPLQLENTRDLYTYCPRMVRGASLHIYSRVITWESLNSGRVTTLATAHKVIRRTIREQRAAQQQEAHGCWSCRSC